MIVISQFCCTSLWFASNAIMGDLVETFGLALTATGVLTAAIQFGFILGTLVFAVMMIADRFSPSKVFYFCAVIGATCNALIVWHGHGLASLMFLRFLTGFSLAGIYPVGMKIASDYYQEGLGKSLGFLVGALVLGTAFPHLLKGIIDPSLWKLVILATSSIALIGGTLMIIYIPDGPYRLPAKQLEISAFIKVFHNQKFRAAAFGYFGHMWELYTFWAFVPILLKTYSQLHANIVLDIPTLSFLIIAIGGVGCVIAAYISRYFGVKKTATLALALSCLCCIVCPFIFMTTSEILFIAFLMFWGLVVIADSPLFSTLVAHNAEPKLKGTALTIVNCIGYSITIISILLLTSIHQLTNSKFIYMVLAIGPIIGIIALIRAPK
ncbi:MAG: MFS transporter [Psychroserpens sp.]|uniref:MFS transporter n=1 Tax=Psychroserpens sp. TaxID=2020870 RepID=UPI003C8F92F3